MTRISDALAEGRTLSFEFFPPKTDDGLRNLHAAIQELEALDPSFVSVTYGAGGSTRDLTRDLVVQINRDRAYPAMPHLTCIGHTRSELVELLDDYRSAGIHNILALAGDPPADGSPATGDFSYASELIELVRETGGFSVAVAAFPELHPRSPDRATDRRHLADKLGMADFGITQFFFDVADYTRMMDELTELGCDTPVLPGVLPVINPESAKRFAAMNGAMFPDELDARLAACEGAEDRILDVAVEVATQQCVDLLAAGAPGIHLYALNRSEAAKRIMAEIDLDA
jgi:methylenetetrahydrofolate reductase (NADPH)